MNKRLFVALIAWTGLLSLAVVALLLFQTPQPLVAQTGVANFSTMRVGSFYRAVPRTAITITNNGYLTPTGTYTRITAVSAVGTSGAKIAVKQAGTILYIVNVGAQTITFTETGTLISAGNIALGAGDSAMLLSDGTNYTELGASNN